MDKFGGPEDVAGGLPAGPPEGMLTPQVAMTATIHQDLPEQVIEVLRKHNLKIKLDKMIAAKLVDQLPGMVTDAGCISSPSGPSC